MLFKKRLNHRLLILLTSTSRSAPESFNHSHSQSDSLRKTLSNPISKMHASPTKAQASKTRSDTQFGPSKHQNERCKSVGPDSIPTVLTESVKSTPNSPQQENIDFLNGRKISSGVTKPTETSSGQSSPTPKKTMFEGFRNSLGRSNKRSGDSPTSSPQSAQNSPSSLLNPSSIVLTERVGAPVAGGEASSCSAATAAADAHSSLPPAAASPRVSGRNLIS